jgi:hypothetical protein
MNGYLVVTNRRLLFVGERHAMAGRSILIREVHLPDVSGVSSYCGKGLCIACLIAAAILVIMIIALAHISSFVYILLIFPAWLAWRAVKNTTVLLIIHSRSMDQSPVALVAARSRFSFVGATAVVVRPGPDIELLVSEIGALILDLQTRGNLAVEAWGRGG